MATWWRPRAYILREDEEKAFESTERRQSTYRLSLVNQWKVSVAWCQA